MFLADVLTASRPYFLGPRYTGRQTGRLQGSCLNTRGCLLAAGDVPVLTPTQKISGSLRLSLMQRAPNAVRDYAAHQKRAGSVEPPTDMSSGSRSASADEGAEDGARSRSPTEPDTDPASGDRVSSPDRVAAVSGAQDGLDALAVLADVVESTPQSPPRKQAANAGLNTSPKAVKVKGVKAEADPGPALGAVGALAAIGCAANAAAEMVGADVEFTAHELEVLAKELERCVVAVDVPEVSCMPRTPQMAHPSNASDIC